MENKITFFRLSNSNSYNHFDNNEKVQHNDLQQIKNLRENIYKFSEKNYNPLSEKELDLYQIIKSIRKEFYA
ncbi:hypothetical protein, partial [Tenacibaculum ovolyticum]|uniref:hypothetical protein n=1 Tax=Tenacibaculum ovolyticum TaxID=104270 RepID=UPI001E30A78B